MSSEEKVETIIFNILHQQAETYIKNLNDIISNHVVDEEAKQDLEEMMDVIRDFYKAEDKSYEERKLRSAGKLFGTADPSCYGRFKNKPESER